MLRFSVYPTGRPAWIDPAKVSAIYDAMELKPAAIRGADPMVTIVGTTVVCDGAPVQLSGHAEEIAEAILSAIAAPFPRLTQ